MGAGIWVAPNGLKVFEKLGLADEVIKLGNTLDKISVVDLNYKPISVIDGDEVSVKHKYKTVAIHCAHLHNLLVSKVKPSSIHLGKKLKNIVQNAGGVVLHFEDGTIASAGFVIFSDGIKSAGHSIIHPELNLRYAGQACWRFVTDYDFKSGESGNMYEIWSNKKGLRVGYSKISASQAYVFITNYLNPGGKDNKRTLKEGLLKTCEEFPGTVLNLIKSCNAESIIRNDLYDFAPIKKWAWANLALLGDAARATTPNLGQGACQAIEDAWVIAKMLTAHENISKAFLEYEKIRSPKARFITQTSHRFSEISNMSGLTKSLVKSIIRLTPESVSKEQLDKIYEVAE